MPAAPSAYRTAGDPAKGAFKVGVAGNASSAGAALGAAVSGGSGAAAVVSPPSRPGSFERMSPGFRASTAAPAATTTAAPIRIRFRRRAARPSRSRQAGPVNQSSVPSACLPAPWGFLFTCGSLASYRWAAAGTERRKAPQVINNDQDLHGGGHTPQVER